MPRQRLAIDRPARQGGQAWRTWQTGHSRQARRTGSRHRNHSRKGRTPCRAADRWAGAGFSNAGDAMSTMQVSKDRGTLPAALLPLAKSHMRVEFARDDDYIKMCLSRAIDFFERTTGLAVFAT